MLGICIVFGAALFVAVLLPQNAGLAGLALTSALNLTGLAFTSQHHQLHAWFLDSAIGLPTLCTAMQWRADSLLPSYMSLALMPIAPPLDLEVTSAQGAGLGWAVLRWDGLGGAQGPDYAIRYYP